jgi:acyl-homoserine lactone acylase PvdQ
MTQDALKQMYQLLLTEPHAPTVCAQLERIAREALAEHAMQEVQRLGQEIEQEPVAWQWLGSAHFRKKLPKNADITAWNPLYTTPPKETK